MKHFLIKLIQEYKSDLSPRVEKKGFHCLFKPTCSQYALIMLKKHNLFYALCLISLRLLSCNPINGFRKKLKKR
ncbi:MAG: membrane protein insertion efficiency factor YidD [Candidatus Levyibacteriota bacterium]